MYGFFQKRQTDIAIYYDTVLNYYYFYNYNYYIFLILLNSIDFLICILN